MSSFDPRKTSSRGRFHQHAALTEALRLRGAAQRVPTDADRPPPSTFPGRRPRIIPGQLEFIEEGGHDGA